MLEQEETFRLQVHKLHRLYRVPKQLMKEMRTNKFNREKYCNIPKNLEVRSRVVIDLELSAEACIQHDDIDSASEIEAESNIVLTLAIGSGRRKRAETENTWDSAGSFSASSAESVTKKTVGHGWGMSAVQETCLTSKSERKYEFDMKKLSWLLHIKTIQPAVVPERTRDDSLIKCRED
ncbi:hypothetical protein KSP39_PZI009671 [Platanthera zijinensis]|uniref:Uncharacterized protein n=1 Tax=Platanthera zijinensis TaxID=2320716 RepID=A0AAP0BMD3_9ASPA